MSGHRFINIHRRKRRYVETRKPHINYDDDFQRAVVVFEPLLQLFLVGIISDNRPPVFRIFITGSHHNSQLVTPHRTHFENPTVNLDRYWPRIGYYHRLTRLLVLPEFLIVFYNVLAQ